MRGLTGHITVTDHGSMGRRKPHVANSPYTKGQLHRLMGYTAQGRSFLENWKLLIVDFWIESILLAAFCGEGDQSCYYGCYKLLKKVFSRKKCICDIHFNSSLPRIP